jgi:biotin synthase
LGLALRELNPKVVTVNILNPRPGSRLAEKVPPSPLEAIKWIAIFRLMLPRSAIKLAGGREPGLRGLQATALLAGADGLIVGGYLTTGGRPAGEDLGMLADCGFEPAARS